MRTVRICSGDRRWSILRRAGRPYAPGVPLLERLEDRVVLSGQVFNAPLGLPLDAALTPVDILVADLDGDGQDDAVVVGETPSTSGDGYGAAYVVLNPGGRFAEPIEIARNASFHRVEQADLNRDGAPDLVLLGIDQGDGVGGAIVRTYLNDGAGNFTLLQNDALPFERVRDLAVADVRGSTRVDLIVISEDPGAGYAVLRGTSGGLFDTATPIFGSAATTLEFVRTGDFDGDGRADLLLGASEVFARSGFGTGLLVIINPDIGTNTYSYSLSLDGAPEDAAVGDLDGDGLDDVIFASYIPSEPETRAILGAALTQPGGLAWQSPTSFGSIASFLSVGDVELRDIDGDGHLDAAALIADADLAAVLFGDGSGAFDAPRALPLASFDFARFGRIALGDFNADDTLDVFSIGSRPELFALPSAGRDAYATVETWLSTTLPSKDAASAAGDFNGDGLVDAAIVGIELVPIAGFALPTIQILTNSGGRLVETSVLTLEGGGYGRGDAAGSPRALHAADTDGDGLQDLVLLLTNFNGKTPETSALVFRGNGDGTFSSIFTPTLLAGAEDPLSSTMTDLNGDGRADLVVGGFDGSVRVYLADPSGAIAQTGSVVNLAQPVVSLAAADLDGDGDLDVAAVGTPLFRGDVTSVLHMLTNDGAGALTDALQRTLNQLVFSVAAGDLNGDGLADLALAGVEAVAFSSGGFGNAGVLQLVRNRTQGPGAPDLRVLPTLAWRAPEQGLVEGLTDLVIADLSGDGVLDLVGMGGSAFFAGTGTPIVFRGLGQMTFALPESYSMPMLALHMGDLEGDGDTDLLGLSPVAGVAGIATLRNEGDGQFQQTYVPIGIDRGGPIGVPGGQRTLYTVVAADLDGDGIPDLAATTDLPDGDTGLWIALGNGTWFDAGRVIDPSLFYGVGLEAGDVDNDGDIDLVLTTDFSLFTRGEDAPPIIVLINDGTGLAYTPKTFPLDFPNGIDRTRLADVNGDDFLDIIYDFTAFSGTPGEYISVWLGSATGDYAKADDLFIAPSGAISDFAVGEFTGDGVADLVIARGFGMLEIHQGDGLGGFALVAAGSLEGLLVNYSGTTALGAANLDASGADEIVVAYERFGSRVSTRLAVLTLDDLVIERAGVPTDQVPTFTASPIDTLAFADLNLDGFLDVIGAGRSVHVRFGSAEGLSTSVSLPTLLNGVVLADHDLDGDLDLFGTTLLAGVPSPGAGLSGFVLGTVENRTRGVFDPTNAAPTLTTAGPIDPIAPSASLTLTFAELLALTDAADPDGDALSLIVRGLGDATVTINGAAAQVGDLIAAGDSITITAPSAEGLALALRLVAYDGQLDSGSPVDLNLVVDNNNQPPVLDPFNTLGLLLPGEVVNLTYAQLLALANVSDPEGDAITFVFQSIVSGSLTINGVAATAGDLVAPGDVLAYTAPLALGQFFGPIFRAFDGNDLSAQARALFGQVIQGGPPDPAGNTAPTLTMVGSLGNVFDGSARVITHAELLALSDAFDADGDPISFRIVSTLSGSLFRNGLLLNPGFVLNPGESFVWISPFMGSGTTGAFTIVASDGQDESSPPVTVSANIVPNPDRDEDGPFEGRGLTGVDSAVIGADGTITAGVTNRSGEAIIYQYNPATDEWVAIDLGFFVALGADPGHVAVWIDPKDGNVYAALASNSSGIGGSNNGILVYRQTSPTVWVVTTPLDSIIGAPTPSQGGVVAGDNEINAPVPGSVSVFVDNDGIVNLFGLDEVGNVMRFRQTGGVDADGNYTWSGQNISDLLESRGRFAPTLTGRLVAYQTTWDAIHVHGLDAAGQLWSVWISNASDGWRSTNLSAISGAPRLVGGLDALQTSWNAIHLTALDAGGNLWSVWWLPAQGEDWASQNLTGTFEGLGLDTTAFTAFTHPWGGLNVVGVDSLGTVSVYWWAPGFGAEWKSTVLSNLLPAGAEIPVGRMASVVDAEGNVTIVATNGEGEVFRYFWQLQGDAWGFQDIDAVVESADPLITGGDSQTA